jgi:hypothetical protein
MQHGQVNHCNDRRDRNGDGNRLRKYPRDRRSADDVEPADERQIAATMQSLATIQKDRLG